ncbi:MAG: hypothetical protein OFPI_03490 [Osedax symbiont Rs2]|nr:MAG: hypothetical protein OFPI_03490 [Osedax symbiont Rs2]
MFFYHYIAGILQNYYYASQVALLASAKLILQCRKEIKCASIKNPQH